MPLFYFMTVDPFLNYLATASTHCKHVVHKSASFLYKMLIQTLNYKCALKFTLFPAMPFCLFYDSEPIPQLSCNTVVNQSGSFLYKMQIQTPNYKCALNLHLVCSSALECITTCEYDSMVLVHPTMDPQGVLFCRFPGNYFRMSVTGKQFLNW